MSGWIGLSPREVPCGSSARQGLYPLLQEPSSASLPPSNSRETGLPLSGPDRAEDADPPATGFCYYTPLVMVGSMLIVGHPAALSRVADPSELRATRTGGPGEEASTTSRILLRWRWAPEATATRLLARQGSPPRGSSNPDAIVTTVARADYERLGSWTLDLPRTAFAEPSNFELQPANVPANDPFSLRSDHCIQCLQSCRDRRCQPCFSGAGAECHDRRAGPASADHRIVFLEAPVASGSSLGADLADRAFRSGGPADGSRRQRTGHSSRGRGW